MELYLLFALLCVTGYLVGTKIEMHVRKVYPETWQRLGFPDSSPFHVHPKEEGRYAKAQIAMFRLLWNNGEIFSSDLLLARLRRAFLANLIAAAMVAGAMILLFVNKDW